MKRFSTTAMEQISALCSLRLGHKVWHLVTLLSVLTVLALLISETVILANLQGSTANILLSARTQFLGVASTMRHSTASAFALPRQGEKPQSGWLYVLDSNKNAHESQVLLVDPEQGRVVRTFKAGHVPDMALSPDGTRLYIAYTVMIPGQQRKGLLEILDTSTGTVLQTIDNPDRALFTLHTYLSRMMFSLDGRWLYFVKNRQTSEGDFFHVATFDTVQGRFLPEKAALPGCGPQLLPSPVGRRLNVVCTSSNNARFLELNESGDVTSSSHVSLAQVEVGTDVKKRVGPGFLSSDGSTFKVIMGDGSFYKIDANSRNITQTGAIDSEARRANDWLVGGWIGYQAPMSSPDKTKLYLGIAQITDLLRGRPAFDHIVVLGISAFDRIATIKTSRRFHSLAISKDGRQLYGVDPESASLLVIDTTTSREIRTISDIGVTPILAVVAP